MLRGQQLSLQKVSVKQYTNSLTVFTILQTEPLIWQEQSGRVGASKTQTKTGSQLLLHQAIQQKLKAGYSLVTDWQNTNDPEAYTGGSQLINWLNAEADQEIKGFLNQEISSLTQEQICTGRALLDGVASLVTTDLAGNQLAALVEQYYQTIPTLFRSKKKLTVMQMVAEFISDLGKQEQRLDQLAATQKAPSSLPGVELSMLPNNSNEYATIEQLLKSGAVHHYKFKLGQVFKLTIKAEQAAFDLNQKGKELELSLFHGTSNANLKHILQTGLICPKLARTGRMFGHGIYFADKASKAANYAAARCPGVPEMMLLCNVAVGRVYPAKADLPELWQAPVGFDSVMGQAGQTKMGQGYLKNNEYIVYDPAQVNINYLISFSKY